MYIVVTYPGIYLFKLIKIRFYLEFMFRIYTRYITGISIGKVYTWYIPGIYHDFNIWGIQMAYRLVVNADCNTKNTDYIHVLHMNNMRVTDNILINADYIRFTYRLHTTDTSPLGVLVIG